MNSDDLLLSSYFYDLPKELIAQRPRDQSRLMIYKMQSNEVFHDYFSNIHLYLPSSSLLIFNQSKVFPSRLLGSKESGGKAEFLFLSTNACDGLFPVMIKTRSRKKIGDKFYFDDGVFAIIEKINEDATFCVRFNCVQIREFLHRYAKLPIPPYIRNGESDQEDKVHYQTTYAKDEGSVAAPTAGLHFKEDLLKKLEDFNIDKAFVTLHVGLGTFKPVTTNQILDHKMHYENFYLDAPNFQKIDSARKRGASLFAVGTTSLRVLESIHQKEITPDQLYSTNIFLYPGKEIHSIDGLITNFHLPESTLLMLVSSLIGRQKALELYSLAIKERYRFFSYGDGMLIIR